MLNHIRDKNGFTIVELLVAGAISVTMIGVGFSILQIALKGNKIDETQMGLGSRLNDTLDLAIILGVEVIVLREFFNIKDATQFVKNFRRYYGNQVVNELFTYYHNNIDKNRKLTIDSIDKAFNKVINHYGKC